MPVVNAHVQTQLDELTKTWWAGYNDGYYAPPVPLPAFYGKPYTQFTAYERGHAFGRELKAHETDRIVE